MNSQHVHHHSNKRNEKRGDGSVHSSPDALKSNYKKHQDDSNHLKFSRSRSESNDSNKLIRKKQYDRNESSKSSQDGLPVKKSSSNSSMSSSSDSLHHSPSNSSESHKLNKSSRNNSSPSSYKKSISNEHDDDENNNSSIKEQKIANDEQPLSHDNSDFDESIKIKESIIEHETVMNADEMEEEKTKDNSISNKSNSSSNSKKGDNYIQDDIATTIHKESNENETNHETSNPDANETSNNQSDLHAIDDKKMEQSSKIFESDEGKNNQKENGENDQQNDIENQSKADDSHNQEQESDAGSEDSNPYLHHRFQVLRSFIKKIPSKKAKDGYVIDVSGVFSSKCLEAFVKASAKPPKRAEESFFQAMRAHVGGYRGHDHFTPEEETAMLKYIRFNPNWPCFKGKFSELKFQKRDKGYYEKRATKDHQQDVPTPTSNKSSKHHFLDKDNRDFAHSKDNAKSETKSSSESSKETKPNRNNQETEDEDDDNDNEDNEEDEGDEEDDDDDEDQEDNEEDIKAQFLVNHKKKRKKVRKSLESILAKKRKPRGVMLRGGGWSKVEESELAAIVLNNYDLDTPSDKIDWEFVVKNHNWGRTPHAAERRWNGKIRPKEKLERDEAVKRAFESSKRKSASYSLRAKNGEKLITTTSSSTHIESSAQTEATESISVEVDKSKIALDKKVEMRNRRSQLTQGSRGKMEVQENQEPAPSKSLPPSVSSTSGPTLTINEKVVEQDHDDDDDDEIFESSSKRQKTSTEPSNNDHVELEIRESVAKPTIAMQISAPSTTAAESTEVVRSSNQSESMEQEEQKLQVASSTPHSSTTAAATVPAPASAPPMPVQPQPAPSSYYPYPPYYMGYPYPPMYPPGYPPQPLPNPSPSSVPQMPMHPMAVPVPVPVPVPYPMQSAHPGYYGAYPPRQAPPYPYPPPGYPSPYPPYAHGYPPPSPYGARPPQM